MPAARMRALPAPDAPPDARLLPRDAESPRRRDAAGPARASAVERLTGAALRAGGITALGPRNLGLCLGSATSGRTIFTDLGLSLLICKMGMERLPCLCVGRPHPNEDQSARLRVDSAVSHGQMRRKHRPGAQQAGALAAGLCSRGELASRCQEPDFAGM